MFDPKQTPIYAILLAAGRGLRAGPGLPKTYRKIVLNGMCAPLLRHSFMALQACPAIVNILPVIHPDDADLAHEALLGLSGLAPVFGGSTRAESVKAGMEGIGPYAPKFVLIHDGARPFVSRDLLGRLLNAVLENPEIEGVIPALSVVDALWAVQDRWLVRPIPRAGLVRAQTPQLFSYRRYLEICGADPLALDDAQAAVQAGLRVEWVVGEEINRKLTTEEDFRNEGRISDRAGL